MTPDVQGRLRALGIASDNRLPLLKGTPTLVEQGIALRFATWGGLFALAGTSTEIIQRSGFGSEIITTSPEEFDQFNRAQMSKWAKVV